jgi:mannosyltransferase OCH1-like enzyme
MDRVPSTPRIIYSLWLQGEKEAPDVCRLCFDRWAALNPDYELRILDFNDVRRLLGDSSIPFYSMRPQAALSNVTRARLLLRRGGIWVDSTLFPLQPLDEWLPETLQNTGFFAFERPGERSANLSVVFGRKT